ncbi:1,4-alpha-glucan branching protein GlgB [candidate division WOR-3 bacterium]|nr:1,4-alpha-glucan branching protein GlgB [candidate division WOR-3 bacterium]
MNTTMTDDEIIAVVESDLFDPFSILGMHRKVLDNSKIIAVRVFLPDAKEIFIVGNKETKAAKPLHPSGLFESIFPDEEHFFPYRIKCSWTGKDYIVLDDPYRLPPVLSDYDIYLFNEGSNTMAYEKLGAHVMVFESIKGTLFALWAPNAKRVSVVGDFNHWDGRRHPMRSRGSSGIWELFLPEITEGCLYKYEIKTQQNLITVRSDPYGFHFEKRPRTSSRVFDLNKFNWTDEGWMGKRSLPLEKPVAIYEMHLSSWMKKVEKGIVEDISYRELPDLLIPYLQETGFNYVEFMPLAEHPLDDSWGYQVTGYYAPTSRFGTPDDLKYLIDRLHGAGIGVIVDWVPGHFPKDSHALAMFDGTALYEHQDPRQGFNKDWGTLIFNYERREVKSFLISNAVFWFDKFHVDGLRVDAVASMLYLDYSKNDGEWIPNKYGGKENLEAIAFLKTLNLKIFELFPSALMVAEESTSWPMVSRPVYLGGLGFAYKWNMGWMNDFLSYISKDPVFRKYHRNDITFSMLYAFTENFILPISHDEVVHGKKSFISKMPGDYWQKFANARLALGFMFSHPGKKLLFMGSEFGQWEEWQFNESLDWHLLKFEAHSKLKKYVSDLVKIYKENKALWEVDFSFEGFSWIDFHDTDSCVISFVRWAKDKEDHIVVLCNFTPVVRQSYRVGVPSGSHYKELLNSDSEYYYGSNVGNFGLIHSEEKPWHSFLHSIEVTLPPLSVLYLAPEHRN